jgi:hypothetical protein
VLIEGERKPIIARIRTGKSVSEPVYLTGLRGAEIILPDVLHPPVTYIDLIDTADPEPIARIVAQPGETYTVPDCVFEAKSIRLKLLTEKFTPVAQNYDRAFLILPIQ